MDKNTDEFLDTKELVKIIFNSRIIIFTLTLLSILTSLIISLYLKNLYTSDTVLEVRKRDDASSSLSQYSELAALGGIDIPANSDTNRGVLAIQIINSRDFFESLLDKYEIKAQIMASKDFDTSTGQIIYDKRIYNDDKKIWTRKISPPLKPEPHLIEVHKKFLKDILSVSQNKKTGFITISVTHHSPIFAKELLDIIVREINESYRNRELNEASSIAFLQNQIPKYQLIGNKNVIFSLMEKQINTQMMAEVQEDYLLMVIDSPFIPIKKSWPSRILILIVGSFVGFSQAYCL